ncbi:hypothetical protein GCM10023078_19970 [Gibbsiella greigii]
MIERIYDGMSIFTALVLSGIIWITCIAAAWYYHFSDARRYSWQSGSLADVLDLIPQWVMNSVLVAWFVAGSFPILNYVAEKEQFGSIVGRSRELSIFDDRPWYGVGGYQILAIVAIMVAGYLIHRFRD